MKPSSRTIPTSNGQNDRLRPQLGNFQTMKPRNFKVTLTLSGHVFVFRGRRGDILKVLWFDGDGLCLLAKRLERGRFVWPQAASGTVSLSRAQLSMLLEGIDWRAPIRTSEPMMSV
jgi:transposase